MTDLLESVMALSAPRPMNRAEREGMATLQRASDFEPEEVRYLWQRHIPMGMVSLVAGRPGEGKSLLAALLAAELTKRKKNILFGNCEDPIKTVVVPRLTAAGAAMHRVHFLPEAMLIPRDLEELEKLIKQTKAEAVIFDPASAYISASIYNDQEVRTALGPLSAVADRTDTSVIFMHHTIKHTASGHPLRSIGGSGGGLQGVARAAFIFGFSPEDKDERVMSAAKFNIGPDPGYIVFEMDEEEWLIGKKGEEKTLSAGRLLFRNVETKKASSLAMAEKVLATSAAGTSERSVDKVAEAAEWVTNYLSMGRRPQTDLQEDATQYGIAWRTARRAAEEVGIDKRRVGFGKGGQWWWMLPTGHPLQKMKCCDDPVCVTGEDLSIRCGTCKANYGLPGVIDEP